MTERREADPSPLRAGLVHAGMSALVFGGVIGVMGAGIHIVGDPTAAGPHQVVALFETGDGRRPALKTRIEDRAYRTADASSEAISVSYNASQPSLGVPDPGGPALARGANPSGNLQRASVSGVRINGQIVLPGQSLSQVAESDHADQTILSALPVAAAYTFSTVVSDGLYTSSSAGRVPVIASDGRNVATSFARPFSNPGSKPTVSLIIRGLGTNRSRVYTNAAIEELPPEITLSFVANASGLSGLVQRAHAAGHEVLIEVPMEPYDDGRRAALPRRLNTGLDADETISRLAWQLARTKGYFGLLNYQGAKFSTDAAAVKPVMADLAARGVAFIEDGSLPGSVFAEIAADEQTAFAKANLVIDTRMDAAEIETQLLTLESIAMEDGYALGTGIAYPVTIDTVTAWVGRLEAKGILLAPASHVVAGPARQSGSFQTGMRLRALADQEG